MKISISKEQFICGLQAVQNIVGTRSTLPILSNVLLRAEENRLELTATDLDVSVVFAVDAKVEKAGETTLPVKRLFSLVRELPVSEIEMSVDEKNICAVQAGASYYKIHGLPAEEFPPLPRFKDNRKFSIPQEKLKEMLRKTSYAMSTEEARHVLNGIYTSLKKEKLTMVSTDGRRLALAEEDVSQGTEDGVKFIIPTKAVNELNRLLQAKGNVEIRLNENQVSFTLSAEKGHPLLLCSKLVEGSYPNYQQVIPTETKERIALGREELLQALRRAELMTSDKANSVKLLFSKNNLTIAANTPEIGEGRESIAINYKGPEMTIAFNPTFMMDPLKVLANDEVYIELRDELSPGVIKTNGPFLYVLMPMRVN
jgi:DNA polymerase-3 subunit beta